MLFCNVTFCNKQKVTFFNKQDSLVRVFTTRSDKVLCSFGILFTQASKVKFLTFLNISCSNIHKICLSILIQLATYLIQYYTIYVTKHLIQLYIYKHQIRNLFLPTKLEGQFHILKSSLYGEHYQPLLACFKNLQRFLQVFSIHLKTFKVFQTTHLNEHSFKSSNTSQSYLILKNFFLETIS